MRTEAFALVLHKVVGGRLRQSNLGEVWHDDRTWQELANEFLKTLSGAFVIVDRKTYNDLVRDARQMVQVRKRVEEYHQLVSKEKKHAAMNPYARWAEENMKEPK